MKTGTSVINVVIVVNSNISSRSRRLQAASWLLVSCVILLAASHVVGADEDAEECEYTLLYVT